MIADKKDGDRPATKNDLLATKEDLQLMVEDVRRSLKRATAQVIICGTLIAMVITILSAYLRL